MKIKIKGWYGRLPEEMSVEINKIARVIVADYIWEYDGTLGQFADVWGKKFLAIPMTDDQGFVWYVFLNQYSALSWGTR